MRIVTDLLIAFVALIHGYIVMLEMLFWKKPIGRKVFRTTPEQADATATLAANQGLYNGFLVAGLIWTLFEGEAHRRVVGTFFLASVMVAGLFGAMTVNRRILFVQTLPAALALAALWLTAP